MKRIVLLLVLACLAVVPARAQTSVAGEWMVEFWTPRGELEMTMYIQEQGPTLRGYLTNENGEFPLRGRNESAGFTINWQFPDRGTLLDVVFTGKVEGDTMNGNVKLGTLGSGRLYGTRTGQ